MTFTTTTSSSTMGNYFTYQGTAPITSTATSTDYVSASNLVQYVQKLIDEDNMVLERGRACKITMPDGTIVNVDESGNFHINDKSAKVFYKSNNSREFNRYINASDLLEEFIRFVGNKGVRQSQVLDLPVELFINWIIMKAAIEDNEPVPEDVKLLPPKPSYPRCKWCGRFIKKQFLVNGVNFCSGEHTTKFIGKVNHGET